MNALRSGYRGLSLLADLNWDRLLFAGGAAAALFAAAYIISL
ncbi:hypothetical protein [Pseudoruegeria sp. HB172150]|nr:hypothetical protein [Pseudoruegeria sp. HB172150]